MLFRQTRESKIDKFDCARFLFDQNILQFDITMRHIVRVHVFDCIHELEEHFSAFVLGAKTTIGSEFH